MKIIEASAVISARAGDMSSLDKVAAQIMKVSKAGQAAKTQFSAAASDIGKQVEQISSKLGKIDNFRTMSRGLDQASTAMKQAQQNAARLKAALDAADSPTRKMQSEYARAAQAVDRASRAFREQGQAVRASRSALEQAGVPVNQIARQQQHLTSVLNTTTAAMRQQSAAALAMAARQEAVYARSAVRRETARNLAAGAGVMASHKVREGARATLHTYREFDNERRFSKAVLGLSDEEMKPLVDQAIHGGATSKYNDIQYLHGQRDLAARGVKRDAILGMIPHAANLGMATDLSLPEAVKLIETGVFNYGKRTDTVAAAAQSAKQTADVMTLAMKASGMTPEDIGQVYKYGAPSGQMAGLSEQALLSFGGVLKKAGIGGDEAGVAWRALMATAQNPTAGARTALLANGMDYARYQRVRDRLDLDPFVNDVARRYGVKLNDKAQAALGKVFSDKATISDPSKFAPAVMSVLSQVLGGDDAKSKKSIAGAARRYRDASINGVDANAFVSDLLTNMRGNLQFANALFGSKQGTRIGKALSEPEFFGHLMDILTNKSEGYSKKIADERMAGFDGAVSRFEGATKNLETAIGRAWDRDGKGGVLTSATDWIGKAIQHAAELPAGVVQGGSAVAGAAGAAAGAYGVWNISRLLLTGGGLPASAVALNEAAAALTAAAVRLGGAGAAGAVAPGAAAAKGGRIASLARWGLYGAGAYLTYEAVKAIGDGNAELYKDVAPGEVHNEGNKRRHRANQLFRDQMMEDRARLGIPNGRYTGPGIIAGGAVSFGFGPGGSNLEMTPKGMEVAGIKVSGQAEVAIPPIRVEAGSELLKIVSEAKRVTASVPLTSAGSGPGSTGTSMPEAAAPSTGSSSP